MALSRSEVAAVLQWLHDAPKRSQQALDLIGSGEVVDPPTEPPPEPPPPPPPVEPPPTGGGSMDRPTNTEELRDCLRRYANHRIVGQLDPYTEVEVTETIEIAQAHNAGAPWGVIGNYAKLHWKGPQGHDVLRFVGVKDVNNRGLTIERLVIDGGDPNLQGNGAAACLRLSAPLGDDGPLYKFLLRDLYTKMAHNGIVLEGGVYEGYGDNLHVENCSGDGLVMRHMNLGAPGQGVVSNVLLIHPNCSRNVGAGIRSVYSVYIIGGSFILNGGGGVVAPDGLRGMILSNGENTAGPEHACFVIPSNGFGSNVAFCEGSSDGQTHMRRWTGSAWESIGSPMRYLIDMPPEVHQFANHVSFYGAGENPMQVVRPRG
jgi:hypothetical protein